MHLSAQHNTGQGRAEQDLPLACLDHSKPLGQQILTGRLCYQGTAKYYPMKLQCLLLSSKSWQPMQEAPHCRLSSNAASKTVLVMWAATYCLDISLYAIQASYQKSSNSTELHIAMHRLICQDTGAATTSTSEVSASRGSGRLSCIRIAQLVSQEQTLLRGCLLHFDCKGRKPHLWSPQPRIPNTPVAHAVQDGPPSLVQRITHGSVPVHYPVLRCSKAVIILEKVHAQVCKVLRIQLFIAPAAGQT